MAEQQEIKVSSDDSGAGCIGLGLLFFAILSGSHEIARAIQALAEAVKHLH